MKHPLEFASLSQADSPHAVDNINPLALNFILNSTPSNARILEIGCSTGALGGLVLKSRTDLMYYGIEPNSISADAARSRLHGVATSELPCSSQVFDWINSIVKPSCLVFCDVIEHIYDPYQQLHAFLEGLPDWKTVIATLPNISSYELLLQLSQGQFEYSKSGIFDSTHVRFFTYSSAVRFFQALGIEVCVSSTGFLLNPAGRGIFDDLASKQFKSSIRVGRFVVDVESQQQAYDLCSYGFMIVGNRRA